MDSPKDPLMTKDRKTQRSAAIGQNIVELDRNLMQHSTSLSRTLTHQPSFGSLVFA